MNTPTSRRYVGYQGLVLSENGNVLRTLALAAWATGPRQERVHQSTSDTCRATRSRWSQEKRARGQTRHL